MNSADDVLTGLLELLEKDLAKTTITTWFSDAKAVELKQDSFVISTPTVFKRDVIQNRYAAAMKEKLFSMFSFDIKLIVLTEDEVEAYRKNESGASFPITDSDNEEFTFARFVVGNSNRFAHAAAMAVAEKPAMAYNPLLIYGQSGLGKTHLLCSIANAIRTSRPAAKIVYIKGDDFTNELISAIRNQTMEQFRNKYRQADLLLLDDIQFIAGKEQTQEEFFHTFNVLYEAKKQIVLTADRPPKEMYTLEDRLRTRFEWGLLADILPPDYETRMAIVKNKAEHLGISIPEDICQYIASSVTANVRQLEGTVKKIMANKNLLGVDINYESVTKVIHILIQDNPGLKPTPALIINEVAKFYDISADLLKSNNRRKDTLLPRQIAMYIIREKTDMSLPEIGREFGKDHTTVLHSINKIEEQLRKDPDIKNAVRDLMSNMSNQNR